MSNRPSVVSLIIRVGNNQMKILILSDYIKTVDSAPWITSSHEVRIGAIPCKFSWIQLSHFVLAIHKELQGILSLWLIPVGIKAFQMWHRRHQMHSHSRKKSRISGHCGAAECFSVTSKMAAIKQRLTSGFYECLCTICHQVYLPSLPNSGMIKVYSESMVVHRSIIGTVYSRTQPQALPSGYAPGQIKICIFPQAMPQAFYCTIFALRPQALPSGYAPGQIKICIFPQAMPQAFYCTIFALRATPQAMPQAIFRKFRNF
ncbi:hypothetical protein T05_13551 [Trichinella murrelli]|uniref:Uncharacterized protein n=1 Tax=Trichinella murrelli TaxID=144512 RepID=A0A0V0TXQ5_9BILA|nr:hypothetical protein T05_13551 [Trichinella murrelli]